MSKFRVTIAAALAAIPLGCASVQLMGYSEGWVTTSDVSYTSTTTTFPSDFGTSYSVTVEGAELIPGFRVTPFEDNGLTFAPNGDGDVVVHVRVREMVEGRPTALETNGAWFPAFDVTVPFQVTMRTNGTELAKSSSTFQDVFTFPQFRGYATREQALASFEATQKLARNAIGLLASTGAQTEARAFANEVAASFAETNEFTIEVPVVRTAGGLDMQAAYDLLANATGPEHVTAALGTYRGFAQKRFHEDGSPNLTTSYGATCGIAACKLMLGDLEGAWKATAIAESFEPNGEEIVALRRVIWERETATGARVLPATVRAQFETPTTIDG